MSRKLTIRRGLRCNTRPITVMLKNVAQCQRRRLPLPIIFSGRLSIFLGRLQMTAKVLRNLFLIFYFSSCRYFHYSVNGTVFGDARTIWAYLKDDGIRNTWACATQAYCIAYNIPKQCPHWIYGNWNMWNKSGQFWKVNKPYGVTCPKDHEICIIFHPLS